MDELRELDWCADEHDGESGAMPAEIGWTTWCGWRKREWQREQEVEGAR